MLDFRSFLELLEENRIDFLKKNTTHIDTSHDTLAQSLFTHFNTTDRQAQAHAIIDHFSKADPSPNKKYTQWILNRYKDKDFRVEDSERIKTALTHFETHKNRLEKKDINQYKRLSDLENAVHPHINSIPEPSNRSKEKQAKKGAELIHSEDGLTVHKLKTKEAAMYYGAGTRWCTAAKNNNMFDHYNKMGPLYVVQTPDKKKWQFHFQSDQFADVEDKMHQPEHLVKQYPGLKKVKEFSDGTFGSHIHFMEPGQKDKILQNHLAHAHTNEKSFNTILEHGDDKHLMSLTKKIEDHYKDNHFMFGGYLNAIANAAITRDHKNTRKHLADNYIHHPAVGIAFAHYGKGDELHKVIDHHVSVPERRSDFVSEMQHNKNVKEEHIDKIIDHMKKKPHKFDDGVRLTLMRFKNIGDKHLQHFAKDPDSMVGWHAQNEINIRKNMRQTG